MRKDRWPARAVAYICRELGVRLLSISWRLDDQSLGVGTELPKCTFREPDELTLAAAGAILRRDLVEGPPPP